MARRIGVGVIGVGANWRRRYRPALAALGGLFRVHAVFDPAADWAAATARELGCAVADNLTALMESADVQAVVLTGAGWYGLWPLELACRFGKPFLCAAPAALADPLLEPFAAAAISVPHVIDLPGHHGPAFERLQQLLADRLGPPRLVIGECVRPAGRPRLGTDPTELAVFALAARLFGADPEGPVESAAAARALTFGGGRQAVVSSWESAAPHPGPRLRLRIEATTGQAVFIPPGRLSWVAGPDGRHRTVERWADPDTPRLLLEHLAEAVQGGAAPNSPLPLLAQIARTLSPAG